MTEPLTRSGLLAFIVDRVNVGLLVVDADFTIVVFNHFLEAHSGRRSEEVVGKNVFDAFPELPGPWLTRKIRNVLLLKNYAFTSWQQRPYLFRFAHHRTITSSVDYMRQDCTFIPVVDGEGAVSQVCVVVADATDTSIAHTELSRARKEAEAANHAKSEFLATMSHEIRTPLSGVIGMNRFLLETELTSEQRELAQATGNCAASLLLLLNDILDFSKIAAGMMELEAVDFDLRTAMEDAVDLVAAAAHQKGIEIALVMADDVPARMNGDSGRLRQIVLNLASNAVKFTAQGSVLIEVTRDEALPTEPRLRFSVRDTGMGIPADRRDRLFKSFSQVDASTTRTHGGTGLGLAICKRLAELMHGNVGIDSEVGVGSVFWLTLPLRLPTTSSDALPLPATDFSGLRALVIDSHPVSRRTLRARLETLGVTVDEADALDAGLPRLVEGNFGVCLVDRELAEQAAPELRLALERSKAKIVSLGMLGRRPMPAAGAVQATASLNKPIREAPLIACLAEAAKGGDAARRSQADRQSDAGWGTGMRILVAEDNPVNQRIAVRLVERFGFQVDVAVNGLEALAATAACQYAAVLMDGEMPAMDGLEATRQIRQRDQSLGLRVPIIAMTASGMSGDRERFLAAGMDEYVTKPISSERLGEILTRFVRRAEAAHQA